MDTRAPENALASVGPIDHYLAALHGRIAGVTDGEIATYIPELAKVDPELFGIAIATVDGKLYTVGDSELLVHHPVDLESLRLRLHAGRIRAGLRAVADRGRADRRGVQLDHPRRGPQAALQSDGQRRRDGRRRADQGRHPGSADRDDAPDAVAFRRAQPPCRRIRAPLGAGDRSPEPRDRLHDAELRHDPQPARNHPRYLFPPVLGARHLRRPGGDGRHLRQ